MKLNLACGRNRKEGFINVDLIERGFPPLDLIMDLTKPFPWADGSCEYIYCEQFLEHLNWLDGKNFLYNCYQVLEYHGTLRLVIPDYKKIFRAYLDGDSAFFEPFRKSLNEKDYLYYSDVYDNPERVKMERTISPPPEWHTSHKYEDRERLRLRIRKFDFLIDFVHYFTHQFFEHKCLYDYESLEVILKNIGFSKVQETSIKDIDSHEPTRIDSSLFLEVIK